MLTALMIVAPRREIALETWKVWHLSQEGSVLHGWGEDWKPTLTVCALSGKHLFGHAFKRVIERPDLAARVVEIRITSDRRAEIHYDAGKISRFDSSYPDTKPILNRWAVLNGAAVRAVCKLLTKGLIVRGDR